MSYGDLTPTVDEQATSIEVPAVSINDYRVMRMFAMCFADCSVDYPLAGGAHVRGGG